MRSEIYTKIRCRSQIKQTFVQDSIRGFVDKRCSPFFALEVQNHIKLELGILLQLHQIRSFMKTSLNISYKKGNKLQLNLDREMHNLLQQLFTVMLVKQLSNIKLLPNIDESTINRDSWNHYSWLRIGEFWSLNNIIFKQSISNISLIANYCLFINLFKYQATSAKHLILYIKHSIKYIKDRYSLESDKIGIVLDNWQTHKANIFRRWWSDLGVRLYYLNIYSPEL